MEEPKIAQKGPYVVDVTEDEIYYRCPCGRSSSQPFCDGSTYSCLKTILFLLNK